MAMGRSGGLARGWQGNEQERDGAMQMGSVALVSRECSRFSSPELIVTLSQKLSQALLEVTALTCKLHTHAPIDLCHRELRTPSAKQMRIPNAHPLATMLCKLHHSVPFGKVKRKK